MAGIIISWLAVAMLLRPCGGVELGSTSGMSSIICEDFSSFPDSVAVSTGTDVRFLCDYPENEGEVWSNSCAPDADGMCTCNFNNLGSGGVELCFTGFHQDCSGTYQCNITLELTGLVCSAEAEIVATDDRFTEHPANISAVEGNRVSFECNLLSDSDNIFWQRNNSTIIEFLTSSTPPGNYIFETPRSLTIDAVQADHAGQYRCALEVQDGIYLFSNYGELKYLGEGVTLAFDFDYYILEEGNSVTVCIGAVGSVPENHTFDFTVITYDNTAESVIDYQSVNFTRTIGAIESAGCLETFSILTVEDSLTEADERFTILVTSSSFIVDFDRDTSSVIIVNDDFLAVGFSVLSSTVSEDTGSITVCVSSQGLLSGVSATVTVFTTDGTATDAGGDYDSLNATYSVVPDSAEELCVIEIMVAINDDSTPEPEQCFYLQIESSDSWVNIGPSTLTICISDNDNITVKFDQAEYAFRENSMTFVNILYDTIPEDITIRYNVNQTSQSATAGVDYLAENETIAVSENSDLIYQYSFTISNDNNLEGNETFSLHLSSSDPKVTLATPTTTITITDIYQRVDIDFEQSTYTFSESDSPVSVCVVTLGEVTYNFSVLFHINTGTPESTAIADEDYTSYTFSIRLEIGETAICRNGTMLRDGLVEGTENFILQFSSTDPPNIALNADSGSNIIQTQIFIEDSTVFELQFESSFYEVSESAGILEVCLQVIETSEVAIGVAVDVLIVEVSDEPLDGVAFNLPAQQLSFYTEDIRLCTTLGIINDTTVHGDREALLNVEAVDSQFVVTSDTATIRFIDEQEVVVCGDLLCQNDGECLDDFLCLCPPNYTGAECETRIIRDPTLQITSSIEELGETYEAVCTLTVDSETDIEGAAVIIQWLTGNGDPVTTTDDVTVGTVAMTNSSASLSFTILSLTTAHAGLYTCQGSLINEEIPTSLEQSLNITFTLPAPFVVFILQVPPGEVTVGESVSLRCTTLQPGTITTSVLPIVEWTVGDGEALPDSSRFEISPPVENTGVLTISPVLVEDAGTYTCRSYYEAAGEPSEYLYSSPSNSRTAPLELSVNVRNITVDLTADPDRVPAEAPYNTFQLTCSAEEIESQDSLTFQIQWMRETGPDEVETVTEDSQTIIETSGTDPESVLTATRTETGQYVFYCNVEYLYDGEVIISATSNYQDVNVVGPMNPTVPVDTTVYGTGPDFAIIQWTVSRVAFTPETYYIEYVDITSDDSEAGLTRVPYPYINEDFDSTDVEYTFVVNGLSQGRMYGFKVVAENSNGETSTADFNYSTREQDPFIISEDDNFFSFPIGATIDLQFVRADGGIIDGSGFDMATFELFPELHTPLQQPNIAYSVDLFVSVRYTSASPSLTGDYVLCSQDETPFLCGGQITLDITIPSLSISTGLLVSQYVDGTEVNNVSPEIVCMPSDPRAPIRWTTIPVYIDLEQVYGASFEPAGLNHTLRFPSYYEQLPARTLRVMCDLIDVDQDPGDDVSPLESVVVFVQNPVALLNNDREMEPNAVINSFSQYGGIDYLSLVCVGTTGSSGLVWETESGVLSNDDDGVSIEYYSEDRRDTLLVLQQVNETFVGSYTCRSTESDQEATVLVTLEDPYFAFTSLSSYIIPLGVRVEISARYAYSSNGVNNSGSGFTYKLTFQPSSSSTTPPSNETDQGEQLIEEGSADDFSNNYIYPVYGSRTSGGVYNLSLVYTETQEVYSQTTSIIVTVPDILIYEDEVVSTFNQNVTLSCFPDDLRAPVLWNLELAGFPRTRRQLQSNILLHDYPQYFIFNPPSLRFIVNFNVSAVTLDFPVYSDLQFNCGFMDGEDDRTVVNGVDVSLLLQSDIIQLKHAFFDQRIFNNTVVNLLGEGGGGTLPPPPSKRGSPVQDSLYVDCIASQGNHQPFWTTSNLLVGRNTTSVPSIGEGYGAESLSAYMARLSFNFFVPEYEGVYTCLSARSRDFVEIFITADNPYVEPVTAKYITVEEDTSVTLEFKVAVDSDGNSWNTEDVYFTFLPFLADDELTGFVEFAVCDPAFPQNYCYTIQSVDRSQEGFYIATATSQREDSSTAVENITLSVIRRCPVEVNSGIQWPRTLERNTASRPCTEAGSMFRAGPKASRRCNDQGEWEEADLTTCTIAEIEDPFLLVWFVIDADQYTDDQEEQFLDSMREILDMNGVAYTGVTLKSVYVASVAVTFQVDLVEEDQTSSISQLGSFVSDSESFSSFDEYAVMDEGRGSVDITVADTCMCLSANLGSSLQLCTGAALSPCDCEGDTCNCQSPFVGDGMSCTLDSDSDGYPDKALDSPSCEENPAIPYCNTDVCPEVTNPEQDPMACQAAVSLQIEFTGCPYGPDDVWGILWPNTEAGTLNTQPCPSGVDALGNATRFCYENGTWGDINVLSCRSLAIVRVVEEATELLPPADEEIEEVTPELVESAVEISSQLAMATDSEQEAGLLPLDLESTNNVVAQVLNVLESSVEGGVEDVPGDELLEVFNNILNETNQAGWTQLQTVASGSQTLLLNAERYGTYLATTVNDTNEPLMLVRENIVVAAEVVNTSTLSDVVFPTNPGQLGNFSSVMTNQVAQITIPGDSLSRLSGGNNTEEISLVHIIFRNIEDFLPTSTTALDNSRAESLVISTQLGPLGTANIPDNLFTENPITLNFSFRTSPDTITRYAGVFWNFSDPVGSGGWSSDGIQVISNTTRRNVTTVLCNSTHLTSFAVLVDVAGGLEDTSEEERLALQIVSYIGCIISTICLSITVVFYLAMGKKLFVAVHYFIHLNLALSLLLGYVVFMLGIELGNSTRGGCGFVAALLQYLFLSAFCWMMCEGIMLYLMLIVVFSKLSSKWWFFLILGYCTPLLFVVIGLAARAEYYGVRGEDGELTFCWLSTEQGTIFAFVVPMIVIIIINTVFLVLAVAALLRSKKQKSKALDKKKSIEQAATLLKATVILLPLLGVTWLFGLLTLNNNATVFAWLFTIFNSFQGAGIFFFHVIRSKTVWSKISPTLSRIKKSTLKSSKYYVSSSYSASEDPSSTGTMRTLLRKKPLPDSSEKYELGAAASTSMANESLAVSEAEVETGVEDTEKKDLEPIPEKGGGGAGTTSFGGEKVITNPTTTSGEGSQDDKEEEEVTRM